MNKKKRRQITIRFSPAAYIALNFAVSVEKTSKTELINILCLTCQAENVDLSNRFNLRGNRTRVTFWVNQHSANNLANVAKELEISQNFLIQHLILAEYEKIMDELPYVSDRRLKNGYIPLKPGFTFHRKHVNEFILEKEGEEIDTCTTPKQQANLLIANDAIDWDGFWRPATWETNNKNSKIVEVTAYLAFNSTLLNNNPDRFYKWKQSVEKGKDVIFKPIDRDTVRLKIIPAKGFTLTSDRYGFYLN